MYRGQIFNLDTHQEKQILPSPPKPNRLESEKHKSESTVMERHRLPRPVCYTVGVEKAASWQLHVHIHLEPVCPCFLGFNPPKRWPFPSKTMVIFQVPGSGSEYIWVVVHPKLHGKYSGFCIMLTWISVSKQGSSTSRKFTDMTPYSFLQILRQPMNLQKTNILIFSGSVICLS